MTDLQQSQLNLEDGTAVRFVLEEEISPVTNGMSPAVPVSRPGRTAPALATNALRATLKPLGPLVQGVHDAISTASTPPSEITVTFGVQVGQDLKLGIVNGSGQAHLTVTATWRPEGTNGEAQGLLH
ncbi:CU044_2847 family protein [Streptomyces sp. NPDC005791]|uniref:CU044_2847 family protein n=1 Tax=Streptomyces sp. NPDC005791 TaxID=3364732 RepID=UPI00368B763B